MRNFLLLYNSHKGENDFAWFDTEDELRDFLAVTDIYEIESAIEIFNSRDIDLAAEIEASATIDITLK